MEILEAEGTARFPLTAAFPAQWIETDQPDRALEPGIALCLSGGGYRAMLFHLGALWRLNHLGFLPRIARISSVSGGSITAGVLGMAWSRLGLDASGVGGNSRPRSSVPSGGLPIRPSTSRPSSAGW